MRRLTESQAKAALIREGVPAVRDPVGALQQLAGEVLALKDVLAERVAALQEWRYESRLGAEQLRSELLLLERAQDRAGRLLTDLAKLGVAGRLEATLTLSVEEAQRRLIDEFPGVLRIVDAGA